MRPQAEPVVIHAPRPVAYAVRIDGPAGFLRHHLTGRVARFDRPEAEGHADRSRLAGAPAALVPLFS